MCPKKMRRMHYTMPVVRNMSDAAQQCPWCLRWALKNDACNWVCCGLTEAGFVIHGGCGRQFCFHCGKKLCGQYIWPHNGARNLAVGDCHSAACCGVSPDMCPGGHNSHR